MKNETYDIRILSEKGMKNYETPEFEIVIYDVTIDTALVTSAQTDGNDNDVKFDDVWNRG